MKNYAFAFSAAVITLFATFAHAQPVVLFSENFDRPNNTVVGNGWTEQSYRQNHAGSNVLDAVSIFDNKMRVTHSSNGFNVDAGLFRPLSFAGGVVVSGNANWMNNPAAAVGIGLNTVLDLQSQGLNLSMNPRLAGGGSINISHEGVGIAIAEFSFDLAATYSFEWVVQTDFSTEALIWKSDEAKPLFSTISSAAVTPVARTNPLFQVAALGGSGCCTYPGYDVRIDDILVTGAIPEPSSLALIGIGLAGIGFARRRKQAA